MKNSIKLGRVEEFTDNEFRLFQLNLFDTLVGRCNGRWLAWDAQCPHGAYNIGKGIVENNRAVCPGHGLTFDLNTGGCLEEPHRRLKSYKLEIIDDTVYLVSPEEQQK